MENQDAAGTAQLDLFAWRRRDGAVAEPTGAGASETQQPDDIDPAEIAALASADLYHALEARLGVPAPARGAVVRLIDEMARRGDRAAVPLLAKLCRRHAGFDRACAVPEVAAALRALAAIGVAEAAPAILPLVAQDSLGPEATAAALSYLTAVRHRPAAGLLSRCLEHEMPTVRAAACGLAAAVGDRDSIEVLVKLRTDFYPEVADGALLALGHLGHRPAKIALEDCVRAASDGEIPRIVDALVVVADEETAVALGRVAERSVDEGVRTVIAEALSAFETRAAANWLKRFADDPSPAVRRTVAAGLAAYDEAETEISRRRSTGDRRGLHEIWEVEDNR